MKYLETVFDWQSPVMANAIDELPMWSARPGQLLLEQIPMQRNATVLDIGCGTGFPLLMMARQLGPDCRAIGLDNWEGAISRAKYKAQTMGLKQVEFCLADASSVPLPNSTIDLVTSNLGINNFEDPLAVIKECRRLLKPEGSLCLTTNLMGTFKEFYEVFARCLSNCTGQPSLKALEDHINERQRLDSLLKLFKGVGFKPAEVQITDYQMHYVDGTAMLNDYFMIMAFMPAWKELVPKACREVVFNELETALNEIATVNGRLSLTVPLAYCEFETE